MIAETPKSHFQMTFSLSSTSCLLKLPNDDVVDDDSNVLYYMLRSFFIRSQVAKMRQYATQRQLLLHKVENLQII